MKRPSIFWRAVVLAGCVALAGCSDSESLPSGPPPGNTATPVVAVPTATPSPTPSAAEFAALGAELFYATLDGSLDGAAAAIEALEVAAALDPTDGVSRFRLGMTHFFRFSQSATDYRNPTAAERSDLLAAGAALDEAVDLVPEDRRIPGFRGAATWLRGYTEGDPERQELGLRQLRESIELYPEFNNFSFIGTVGALVPPSDPLYAEVMELIADPLSGCTPSEQPQICGNEGRAPHNIEGALVLFGDLYAKAGDGRRARSFYQLAGTPFAGPGGPWRFAGVLEDRLANLPQRVALYRDDDPTNDPPVIGYREEACAVCHYR